MTIERKSRTNDAFLTYQISRVHLLDVDRFLARDCIQAGGSNKIEIPNRAGYNRP